MPKSASFHCDFFAKVCPRHESRPSYTSPPGLRHISVGLRSAYAAEALPAPCSFFREQVHGTLLQGAYTLCHRELSSAFWYPHDVYLHSRFGWLKHCLLFMKPRAGHGSGGFISFSGPVKLYLSSGIAEG